MKVFAAGFVVLLLVSSPALSDLIALEVGSGASVGGSAFTRGWSFSVTSDITVTSLGMWDESSDGIGSHQIGLWNSSGSLLASDTLTTANTAFNGPTDSGGRFRFKSLASPVGLTSGQTYVVGVLMNNHNIAYEASNYSVDPTIRYLEGRHSGNPTFAFPGTTQANLDPGTFGANFEFAAIPEPTTLALFGAGLLAVAMGSRRRFRAARARRS